MAVEQLGAEMGDVLPPVPPECFGTDVRPPAYVPGELPPVSFVWGHGARRPTSLPLSHGLGWQPDLPDHRDWNFKQMAVAVDEAAREKAAARPQSPEPRGAVVTPVHEAPPPPSSVDLRRSGWLAPVEDQQHIGACTAHAVIGAVEALNNRLGREPMDLSRLFLYKATRNLLGWSGDAGAYIRRTIQAVRLFGVPPEEHWPYDPSRYDEEPAAFHYAFAANYKATSFARLDQPGLGTAQTLDAIKRSIAQGHAVPFGFTVFDSIRQPRLAGQIPFPRAQGKQLGGHAVLAVGYDDELELDAPSPGGLVVQNSWGRGWGELGYGYLPYEYVLRGIAVDFWVILNADWIGERLFT
jgi:C1A family cysteine protease